MKRAEFTEKQSESWLNCGKLCQKIAVNLGLAKTLQHSWNSPFRTWWFQSKALQARRETWRSFSASSGCVSRRGSSTELWSLTWSRSCLKIPPGASSNQILRFSEIKLTDTDWKIQIRHQATTSSCRTSTFSARGCARTSWTVSAPAETSSLKARFRVSYPQFCL
jgi:hypothetical protein